MEKKYGQTNLERFKAANERQRERRSNNTSFMSKLMAGSRRQTESKKYNMPANIGIAKGKRDKAAAESKGLKEFTARRTAAAKSAMTKAEAKAKTGRTEAEKFARKGKSNIAAKKKPGLLSKFKSSKTLAEFAKKVRNK